MKKLFILFCLLGILPKGFSQNVQVTAQAPKVVEVSEQFELVFNVNAEPSNILAPELKDFRLVYGPSTSQSSSVQIINGKMSQTVNFGYTYVMMASKPGKYLIGPAEVTVNGKKYKSNSLTIEVVAGANGSQQQAQGNAQQQGAKPQTQAKTAASATTDGNVFIRVLTDKKQVVQGEYLMATVKLYSKVNISSIDNVEFPTFDGFFKQDVETPPLRGLERENVNGEIYYTGVIKKFILIPQKSGNLTINSMIMDCSVQQQVQRRARSIFDDFWGPSVQNVPMKLKSKPVAINVRPLPTNAPESFNGAVGRFSFDAKIDKTQAKTNDAITVKMTISGNGNIKLTEAPKVEFPTDFDTYDPKITLNTSDASGGISGSKTFEYLVIPRNPGEFHIPPVSFTFFDVASNQYKTIKSNEFVLNIAKGADTQATNVVSGLSKEEIKFVGKDIHFIKINPFSLSRAKEPFFGSIVFYAFYIISFITFALIVWFRRRVIKQNANLAFVKNRRADKFASKRLKLAKVHLHTNEKEKFYDELLKAIWGYLSDKFNIPQSELSRDNAREILVTKNVAPETLEQFISLVDNCEFARYAPASAGITLADDYKKAIDLITKLQQKLK